MGSNRKRRNGIEGRVRNAARGNKAPGGKEGRE